MTKLNILFLSFLLFALVICISCSTDNSKNSDSNREKIQAEKSKDDMKLKELIDKAVSEFVSDKYVGWKLIGVSSIKEDEFMLFETVKNTCIINSLCKLHIESKEDKRKVITVVVRKFINTKGESYYLVYEPTSLDLAQFKIDKIKSKERKAVLRNLSYDDCEQVFDEMRSSASYDVDVDGRPY